MSAHLFEDDADFVIVGTGAGGATAAKVLTDAGRSVIMLEEGPHLRTKDRPRELLASMALNFRDFGTQATTGTHPIPLLQGKLVGGSTAINSGIIWRMPEDVRVDWTEQYGLGELVEEKAMARTFEEIERDMGVEETPRSVWGGNCEKMAEAAEKLGLPGKPMTRNMIGCEGKGQCLQGCPGERRQSMDVSFVPAAMKKGARLHALARAQKVIVERSRAVGVVGDVIDFETKQKKGTFLVRARYGVIVSAGAVHTPMLLRRSGMRGLVGERFQAHPGTAIVGRFPDPIGMSFGASQGYEIPMRHRGFKLESLTLPPEMLATRLPGVGKEWEERLSALDHYAQWCAVIRMKAHGRVRESFGGAPLVKFDPLVEDLARTKDAAALLCRMMFAAGATEVYPGIVGVPEVITSVDQVKLLDEVKPKSGMFKFMSSHLFGTACAGADPKKSVVGPDLQAHDVSSLYVMDASVFPTNLGVNPQHSIMAVTWRAAERLAQSSRVAATG
jgi:choline dehydrogenase-like flavoprotein